MTEHRHPVASLKAKINYWLRWLLVLPTAVVVGIVVGALFTPMAQRPLDYGFPAEAGWLATLAQSLLVPLTYIGAGAWMAPGSKVRTALVLAVFTVLGLASGYWNAARALSGFQLPSSSLSLFVGAIALNAVGVVAALLVVRRLARPRVQFSG